MPDFAILLQAESLGPWLRLTLTPKDETLNLSIRAVVTIDGGAPVPLTQFERGEPFGEHISTADMGISLEQFAETDFDGVPVKLELDVAWRVGDEPVEFKQTLSGVFGGNEGRGPGFVSYIADFTPPAPAA